MITLAAITWSGSPELFSLGPITIRWYGLLFALGFVVGYQIMERFYKREGRSRKDLDALTIAMLLGTIIGARLGHCLFYEPSYYLANPIEILKVWRGGLASHGAAVGILVALAVYSKRRKFNMLWLLDRITIVTALAGSFIRLGNFFNSEIYGKPADLPWAVIFTRVDLVPRHPVQLYESFSYLAIFFTLYYVLQKVRRPERDGLVFGLFLALVFGARFIIEFFKSYQADFESGLPLMMGQFLSIPFIIAGIYFIYRYFNTNGAAKETKTR
ncbi:MAG: prolipoprotein diacylglyceryl transferase [Chloroflexota bacterium]